MTPSEKRIEETIDRTSRSVWFGRSVPPGSDRICSQLRLTTTPENDAMVLVDRDGMQIFMSNDEALKFASIVISRHPLDALGNI